MYIFCLLVPLFMLLDIKKGTYSYFLSTIMNFRCDRGTLGVLEPSVHFPVFLMKIFILKLELFGTQTASKNEVSLSFDVDCVSVSCHDYKGARWLSGYGASVVI